VSKSDLHQRLNRESEITLSVKGRKSGQGSDTNWYKNFQEAKSLKISVSGEEIPTQAKPISDSNKVYDILNKFRSKYGETDVKKYYPKVDVAVEVPL
jgi:hypothetical protein